MRKAGTFLCGILAAALLSGCGAVMPDLTQEESDLISEYAVGVLLKYDKYHKSRLVDTTAYDTAAEEVTEEIPEESPVGEPEQPEQESPLNDTVVIDVSQDTETDSPTSIEEYYGIEDITFQYLGYNLMQSYPDGVDGQEMFFSMDATEGSQLLVLRFMASNVSSADKSLNMIDYGARFRVSVNGGTAKSVLTTMLLDDLQSYSDVIPAGYSVELVSIVEVPQAEAVETIEFILRGNGENVPITLQ